MRCLRVLHTTDHLRAGGAERMVAGLVAALSEGHGVRSVVCTATGERDAPELTALVHGASDEHVVLGRRRGFDPRMTSSLVALGRRHAVDVVHSHPGTLNPHAHLAASILGVPHVVTVHTMAGPLTENTRLRDWTDAWCGRRCSAVATPAPALADALRGRWRLGTERTWVIPNAVFANTGPAVSAAPRPPGGERVVLTAARLLRAKGLFDLLDAAERVCADRPDVRFHIAGDGPAMAELRARIAGLGPATHVELLGHRRDVQALLRDATVFCLPSHHEGVPLSLLEAMSQGVPCVTTAVGGVPDAVTDGTDALLVDPHDVDGLAAALGRVLDDPGLAARLGAAGAATVAREHTSTIAARRYAALYRALAAPVPA